VSVANRVLSVLRRLSIIIAIAVTFLFGLATTVYLSLRSPEVRVPEVVGKDRFEAERILGDAGLNFRVRATRPSNQSKPDTVLFQLPRAGEVVKVGQTVAMDISRAAKEGEAAEGEATDKKVAEEKAESSNQNANSSNDNRPKRNKNVNANKNANENSNSNANTATNNGNANKPANVNAGNSNTTPNNNTTRNANSSETPNRNANVNPERRPTVRPTPAVRPANNNR
jgi:beta-lactam-binding protein with PASTA domain